VLVETDSELAGVEKLGKGNDKEVGKSADCVGWVQMIEMTTEHLRK
jgi:hypothetical protein